MKKLLFTIVLFLSVATLGLSQERKPNEKLEEIIFVFKTHFDIGYTNLAERVIQKYHTSMMDGSLKTLEESNAKDEDKQFVWTLPGWPMKEILERTSGESKAKIEKALREQRFNVHALPLTFETEASDPEVLTRSLIYSSNISRKYGLELPRDAKLTDVPSHSWFIPTLLKNSGIDFLHIGCNPASASPELPLLFWWKGPDGSKLMTMYWGPYYGTDTIPPDDWPYKTWMALIPTHENVGAPSYEEVEKLFERARELAPNAKFTIGRMSDFYDAITKENPELPIIDKDMPDTWIHGYMSMPKETKINKKLRSDLVGIESLSTLLDIWGGAKNDLTNTVANLYEKSILYDEHTFGLAISHGQAGQWYYGDEFIRHKTNNTFSMIENSWKEKGLRVHQAEIKANSTYNRKLDELLESINIEGDKIVVYNSLPWKRNGLVTIYHRSGDFPYKSIKDTETGKLIPIENKENIIRFLATDVPSGGYKTYVPADPFSVDKTDSPTIDEKGKTLENKFVKIQFDEKTGNIISLVNKLSGKEYCQQKTNYGLGQYLYEHFSKENTDSYAKDYIKTGWDWAYSELGRPNLTNEPYWAATGSNPKIYFETDNIVASVYLTYAPSDKMPQHYTVKYALYKNSPSLEMTWAIHSKSPEPWPEAGWMCFPLNMKNPQFKLGRIGGISDPKKDFIKGSNLDYYFLHSGLAVLDENNQGIGIYSPDVPGISLDRPGLWKYSKDFIPKKPNVFFNLYNNQWSTNFTEWIDGSWSARFYLWFIDEYTAEKSLITPSDELSAPLKGKIGKTNSGTLPPVNKGISISRKGISLTAFGNNPDGDGTLLRLWEKSGESGEIKISFSENNQFSTAHQCNLRGEKTGKVYKIKKHAFEVKINKFQPLSFILK